MFIPACIFSFDLGVDFGTVLSLYNVTNPAGIPPYINSTTSYLRVNIFLDFDYLLVRVGGEKNFGSGNSTPPDPFQSNYIFLTGDLMAKLPVVIHSLRLWTAVGLRYVYSALIDYNGDGVDDRPSSNSPHDLAAVAEVGGGLMFGKFLVGIACLISYSITSDLPDDAPPSARDTSVTFEFTLHVGFSL